jgi:hypothetical protein
MTALIVVLPIIVVVEISLQLHQAFLCQLGEWNDKMGIIMYKQQERKQPF